MKKSKGGVIKKQRKINTELVLHALMLLLPVCVIQQKKLSSGLIGTPGGRRRQVASARCT